VKRKSGCVGRSWQRDFDAARKFATDVFVSWKRDSFIHYGYTPGNVIEARIFASAVFAFWQRDSFTHSLWGHSWQRDIDAVRTFATEVFASWQRDSFIHSFIHYGGHSWQRD